MSETSINAALLAARREMEAPQRTATNPHFGSKYAPLDELVRVSFGPLAKHGLMLVQKPTMLDGRPVLLTDLISESGETLACGCYLLPEAANPQAVGSAITYARRYSMGAILGLAAEDDDDGNAATASPAKAKPEAQVRPVSGDRKKLENAFFDAWRGSRTPEQNADKEDWKNRGTAVKAILGLSRFPKLSDMTDPQVQRCIDEWTGGSKPDVDPDAPLDPDGDIQF